MPKQVSTNELAALIQVIAQLPNGGSVEEIGSALDSRLPRRTLQRRLAQLITQQRLSAAGRGRATRYRTLYVLKANDAHHAHRLEQPTIEPHLPVSAEAQVIKQAVREPLHKRKPVGYNRAFLEAYRPNKTFYLSTATCEHLFELGQSSDMERPAGTYVRQIFSRLVIDLSWNSSRLEGNSYSLLETERLLELGEPADGKDAKEAQMILNHKAAIELLVEQPAETGFNRYTLLNLHALLADNLLDAQACGRLRHNSVDIAGTVFHPLATPQLMEDCFSQLLVKIAAIDNPFEQAFFAMTHLPYLQPFAHVNKRVSRLAANLPLIRDNLCPLSFVDVPERAYIDGILGVYELNRTELLRDVFIRAYERSCARYSAVRQSLGEPDPFRMHYRTLIADTVGAVVRGGMNKKSATAFIRQSATENMAPAQRARFVEVVETELMSLHDGNIARYRLRPAEYETWRRAWH